VSVESVLFNPHQSMAASLHRLLTLQHPVAGVLLGSKIKGSLCVVCTYVPVINVACILCVWHHCISWVPAAESHTSEVTPPKIHDRRL